MEAANGGYTEVGSLLLKADADPNAAPVPTSRDTALTIAADKGHTVFVEMLLRYGAAFDVKNKKGCTPLFLTCSNGHLSTAEVLIEKGADPDTPDNRKTTPLVAAFRKGHLDVVKLLVKHVTQFPNDQECLRYCANVSDQELVKKLKECNKIIVDAKTKQAAQADKAAQALIELLDEEERLAKSKEETKKRQKEKKKQKKAAKKQLEVEIVDEIEADVVSVDVDFGENETKEIKAQRVSEPMEEKEDRVPVATVNKQEKVEQIVPANNVANKSRRPARRQRQESNGQQQHHTVTAAVAPLSPITNGLNRSNEDSEWFSAGKKRASVSTFTLISFD